MALDGRVDAVRTFNRFYTRIIGVLDEGHLASPYSLAQVRVLYELAHREVATAGEIGADLGLDAGYLSRIVRDFLADKLVTRSAAKHDARVSELALTKHGQRVFTELDAKARQAIAGLLEPLPDAAQQELVRAMAAIEAALSPTVKDTPPIVLRGHRPGDMGTIVARQAELYAREYGWNHEYEALTSRITADFLCNFDPAREHCWVADRAGEVVGSVFLVKHPERKHTAKLRMLHVEASARGHGIGRQLVRECTEFARRAGYRKITLWTNSVLTGARRIYEAEGYKLVDEKREPNFGKDDLISQTWELAL